MNLIQIENRKGKVSLNDAVHKQSTDKLLEELGKLYGPAAVASNMVIGEVVCAASDALETVEVEINSPGGSVLEGQRIYNALRGMSGRGVHVETVVNGLAASMGSVILMAGDTRRMSKGSRVMIHEASMMAHGDAKTMRRNADLLESISSEIAGIYAERTGTNAKDMRDLMMVETWMDATKAKDFGFIHEIIDHDAKAEVSGGVDIRHDDPTKTDMKLIERLTSPSNEEALGKIESLETQIAAHDAEIEAYKDKIEIAETALQEAAGIKAEIEAKDFTINSQGEAIAALAAERDTLAAELTEAKAATEQAAESAGQIATETLAAIGQPEPLAIEEAQGNSIRDQYNALSTPEERTAFRSKHWNELLQTN